MKFNDVGSGSLHVPVPGVRTRAEHARGKAPKPETATPVVSRGPATNRLLATLPPKECRRLLDAMEQVAVTYGEILYEPGDQIKCVYFPNDCLVSLLTLVDQHQALEVGLVGREGMVGIPLVLETSVSPVRALVQGSGTAMRMEAAPFLTDLRQSPALQRELHRYIYALMAQVTQTAACNRFHVVEARLARWLLMTQDRLQSRTFRLTQEFLAQMLGVRRVGVTKAARTLQQARLIGYSRGNITILDRQRLEDAACTCYEIVRDMHDAVQPQHRHAAPLRPAELIAREGSDQTAGT